MIVGPIDEEDRPWYFSLNNRRLWVLKQCREEGLLQNNLIPVRVRHPKSDAEAKRYSLANCALEAKFLREPKPNSEDCETKETQEPLGKQEATNLTVEREEVDST